MARAQSIPGPKWGLLADPKGVLASPLPSRVGCDKAEQNQNSRRQGLSTAPIRRRTPSSGRLRPGTRVSGWGGDCGLDLCPHLAPWPGPL